MAKVKPSSIHIFPLWFSYVFCHHMNLTHLEQKIVFSHDKNIMLSVVSERIIIVTEADVV